MELYTAHFVLANKEKNCLLYISLNEETAFCFTSNKEELISAIENSMSKELSEDIRTEKLKDFLEKADEEDFEGMILSQKASLKHFLKKEVFSSTYVSCDTSEKSVTILSTIAGIFNNCKIRYLLPIKGNYDVSAAKQVNEETFFETLNKNDEGQSPEPFHFVLATLVQIQEEGE